MPDTEITPKDIQTVILAGGRGTRLKEETSVIPKPMVYIGDKPILFHIMSHYSYYGFKEFIICLGHKGHVIKEFFLDLPKYTSDLVIDGKNKHHKYEDVVDWKVSLIETGEHTLTATRLFRVKNHIKAPHFCLTYGDGLSNIPLDKELSFHLEHGKSGTIAAVHPASRFGNIEIGEDGIVESFKEKEKLRHEYINGGFFIFKREFLDRLSPNENQSLESEPLSKLSEDGELYAYKHDDFWQCMDTVRDREYLEEIYESGQAPWVGE